MADVSNSNLYAFNTGTHDFSGACVVLVRTEWNATIIDELEKGCRKVLEEYGVKQVVTVTVPGAVEIGFAVKAYWESKSRHLKTRPHAFITLGCVIRGDTPHFDYVCKTVTDAVTQLNLTIDVPTIFAVLTVENQQQALERIGGKHGHKGEEAALTALKMIALNTSLRK
ncbi:6,7-dimethyl-8-ribityllumazine synthase [Lacibacter cauensis]|uniref:6,7-dimethyl-8-ribityllumazine synthase n=1 Tax=Lacibacter cauensis TaxID=510947 RepID=A0A562SGZ7_9BACT|nr:6,7-dimethyl-8-ribityllumazine synthase [Lacibacter cauensis]TWI80254.1 6,7-dimethyl-8-ribityllumazine synthase [Lacibacter cauensis]